MSQKGPFILCVFIFLVYQVQAQDIFEAAENGDLNTVRMLIEGDNSLLVKRDMIKTPGNTPLHFAVSGGQRDIVEFLIEAGSDVNVKSYFGVTPLHLAAQKGHLAVVEYLIEKGAEIHVKDRSRHSPVFYAAFGGHAGVVELLLSEGVDIHVKGKNDMTLLHAAASGGHLILTRYLIEHRSDANAPNIFGQTPLHMAAFGGYKAVVELLLEQGSNVNEKGLDRRTPLHLAKKGNHEDVVALLIEEGAENTPWHLPLLQGKYLGQKPPGLTPEVFAPGIISTDGNEFACTFSPDGKEFYYTANGGINNLPTNTILVTRQIPNKWTAPEVAGFSGKHFDFEPHISPDGNRLYFGSRRPFDEKEESMGMHQWIMEKAESGWSDPISLPSPFIDNHVMYVSTTMDGTIYFTGGDGIYYSRREKGIYQLPEKLPEQINIPINPAHPFIAPDERYLIFDAMPHGPEEGARLFISFRKEDGTWRKAINLSEVWESGDPEMAASVSPDGKYLFFAREGNIYWVDAGVMENFRCFLH